MGDRSLFWYTILLFKPLWRKGTYSAMSNNMKLVHWSLMGGLLHLVQRGGDWAGPQPAQSLLGVPNVTAHPSTANVPITVLLHSGPLLCGFNVPVKGLTSHPSQRSLAILPRVGAVSTSNGHGRR